MKVLIFAMLTAVATSQPVAVDPDDPDYFQKILDSLYPGQLPISFTILNYLLDSMAERKTPTNVAANRDEWLHCQREIAHRDLTKCEKFETIYEKCKSRFARKNYEDTRVISGREQGVIDLTIQSFLGIIEFLCKSDSARKRQDLKDNCLEQTVGKGQEFKKKFYEETPKFESTPTKATACQIITTVRPLLESELKNNCNNGAAVAAYLEYFDAGLKPCRK